MVQIQRKTYSRKKKSIHTKFAEYNIIIESQYLTLSQYSLHYRIKSKTPFYGGDSFKS